MINSNNGRYYIVYDDNVVVDGIHENGSPIFSSNNALYFSSESTARGFLREAIAKNITNNPDSFNYFEVPRYSIQLCQIHYTKMNQGPSVIMETMYTHFFSDLAMVEGSYNRHAAKSLLKFGVLNGFDSWGFNGSYKLLDDLLTNPKYIDIVESVVPRHMIENKELFMKTGIKYCSTDELGAIMLTSSNELLQYLGIDKYNVSR